MIPVNKTQISFNEQDLCSLHCQPHILAGLLEACLNHERSQVVADIVLQDAALTARILLAASKMSEFALNAEQPVTSAVQQLGVPVLISLALQAAQQVAQHKFSDKELVFQYRLWTTSQIGGIAARCLAPSVNFPHIEEAQLCGLLLNLGIHQLFRHYGQDYLVMNAEPFSCFSQSLLEKERFGIDHLEVADSLISYWQLDSFLADAIRFLHADLAQIKGCSSLIKIARLLQQFCQNRNELNADVSLLAERLFGLRERETGYLFQWAQGLYPPDPAVQPAEVLRADLDEALRRLSNLIFLLASKESARARLATAYSQDTLLALARELFMEQSPAREVFFFLLDYQSNMLTGTRVAGQQGAVKDLVLPLQKNCCLLADAALGRQVKDSFTSARVLTVIDQLVQSLCGNCGYACFPLCSEDQVLGVVVLKLASAEAVSACQTLPFRLLGEVVSAALMRIPPVSSDVGNNQGLLLQRISREVETPLTIINNYAEVLARSADNPEHTQIIAAIKGEVTRIDGILDDFLNQNYDPNRPEQGVDINQLVRETAETLWESVLTSRNINLSFALQEDLEKVQCNPVLIRQILLNLVKNAAQSLPPKGKIQISTRLVFFADRNWQLEIVVQDNGPGLPEPLLKHLFSSKGAGHAGSRLSIVKNFVDEIGGRIGCHSSPGKGTDFYVQIPYSQN